MRGVPNARSLPHAQRRALPCVLSRVCVRRAARAARVLARHVLDQRGRLPHIRRHTPGAPDDRLL
eukprot:777591-Prymnesium_polylepis.1